MARAAGAFTVVSSAIARFATVDRISASPEQLLVMHLIHSCLKPCPDVIPASGRICTQRRPKVSETAATTTIVVHAEPHLKLFEFVDEPLGRRVDVLGFGDELHVLAAGDAAVDEDALVRP